MLLGLHPQRVKFVMSEGVSLINQNGFFTMQAKLSLIWQSRIVCILAVSPQIMVHQIDKAQ